MFAKITAVAHACPSRIVSNDQLSTFMDTSDEWIFSRTGIKNRHISTGEDTSDLAIKVAQKLLDQKGLDASELDFIIVATITPDSQMPSVAARVQAAIGADRAFAYDLVAACSGFVFALSTAEKLILAGQQKGLVIGAEVFSKILDWSDRSTAVLFGDGAGGVLLENASSTPFVIAEELRTDGSRGDKLTSGATGVHSPFAQVDGPKASIQMDGHAIFDLATRDVPKNMLSVLTKAQLAVEEVDYFLLHQANSRILDKMSKKIGADRHKFLQNMAEYGNTSAASIPILLSESIESGKLSLGINQKIILSGFGGGLTWGTMLIQF